MDFAADAVAEFVALPQQAAGAPQRKPDGPTFEQHLRKSAAPAMKDAAPGLSQAAENTSQTPAGLVIALVQHVARQPGPSKAQGRDATIVLQAEQATAEHAMAPASPVASAAATPPVIAPAPATAPMAPQAEAAPAEIAPTSDSAAGVTAAEAARPVMIPAQPTAAAPEAPGQSALERAAAPGARAPQTVAQAEAGAVAAPSGAAAQPPSSAPPTPVKQKAAEAPAENPAAAMFTPIVAQRQSLSGGRYNAQERSAERLPAAPTRQTAASARPGAAAVITAAAWSPAETSQPSAPASGDITPASMAAQMATATAQTQAPHDHAARAAPAAVQVAREIVRRFGGGSTQFDLRLDPPELGRVDVRLEVSRDHRVTAVVVADNPQALGELARHARDLEQTLQSAGLELSENGLSFDLRQGGETAADAEGAVAGEGETAHSTEAPIGDGPARARPIGLERWRGVRLDMTV